MKLLLILMLFVVPEPPPRSGFTVVYDPVQERVVVHGGQDSENHFADTWVWDREGWRQLDTTGPGDRLNASMAFDGERVILFGGASDKKRMGDTWGLVDDKWVLLTETGPSPRVMADMTFDPNRGNVILFGGKAKELLGDTWEWNAQAKEWSLVSEEGPPARGAHEMAFDFEREKVILFGGYAGGALQDGWEWDGEAWKEIPLEAAPGRLHFAMDYDTENQRLIVFGGFSDTGRESDTWTLNGQVFERTEEGPKARAEHDGVYVPNVGFVVFGGVVGQDSAFDDRVQTNGVWIWNGENWKKWESKNR